MSNDTLQHHVSRLSGAISEALAFVAAYDAVERQIALHAMICTDSDCPVAQEISRVQAENARRMAKAFQDASSFADALACDHAPGACHAQQ